MADIARLAGVSLASVSRALSGSPLVPETQRRRILAIAEEYGYAVNQAARNLRRQSTGTIGLVMPMAHEAGQPVTDPFLLELTGHLSEEVFRRGYDLLSARHHAPPPGWLRNLVLSQRFDAMLVLGQSDQHLVLNQLSAGYAPMVVWGDRLPDQNYCSVGVDNRFGGRMATEHLLSRGRRNILFLGPVQAPEAASRLDGYTDALSDAGLPIRPELIARAGFTPDAAEIALRQALAAGIAFDAIFAASDVIALTAIRILSEAGLSVPGDVSICGFDDIAMSQHLTPALTTVRQDLAQGAQLMVDLLFRRLGGESLPAVIMPPELIVRGTS
ncbi:MAG: LacI family DNA-binding transcriptional regulator [Asticcacaulis sp.]